MARFTLEDIKSLAQDFRIAKDDGRPFALLTGAGCSVSGGVPLTRELVAMVAKKYPHKISKLPELQRHDYGPVMSVITPGERKTLFDPLLAAARVNWAHIALACMMKGGFVGRALTFNFDPLLAKACGVCGLYPAIYDFGAYPAQTFDHIQVPSILHLHGQGSGLQMMNSVSQTQEHAQKLSPLFADTVQKFPLLAVGYSGISDGAFIKLKQCYSGQWRMVWAGYDDEMPGQIQPLADAGESGFSYLGGCDADKFLVALARELGCFPPSIISAYHQHILDELNLIIDPPIDTFPDFVPQYTALKKELARQSKRISQKRKFDSWDMLLAGRYDELIRRQSEAQTADDRTSVAWAYVKQGGALSDLAKLRAKADAPEWQQSFDAYAKAIDIKPDMHEAFYNWGGALSALAKLKGEAEAPEWQKAFDAYAKAISKKPDKHEAYNNWGNALSALAKLKGTVDAPQWGQAFDAFAKAIAIKPDKHEAFHNWGSALSALAELKGTADAPEWQQAFDAYAKAIAIKPDMHGSLNNWGNGLYALAKLKGMADALEWSQAFDAYGRAIAIKPDMHEAFYNWGSALYALAKLKGTADAPEWQQAFEAFAKATAIKPDKYEAFYNWGTTLSALAELKGTADAPEWQQAFEAFAKAIAIKPDMHGTLNNWGSALTALAKLKGTADAPEWQQAFEAFAKAIAIKPDKHEAFCNWGSALSALATLKGTADAPEWQQAFDKFAKSIAIKPDMHEALDNWSAALTALWHLAPTPEPLVAARAKALAAKQVTGRASYNLACILALVGDFDGCKKELMACLADGTLPGRSHLETDPDMKPLRGLDWFEDLLSSLPPDQT